MYYYEKELTVSGDNDNILEEVIGLACRLDWNTSRKAVSWKTGSKGLTFYWYHSNNQNKLPTPIDATAIYQITKDWLSSDEANDLRDTIAPQYNGGDGTYKIGWKISTNESVDDQYSQLLTVTPYRIYYGK